MCFNDKSNNTVDTVSLKNTSAVLCDFVPFFVFIVDTKNISSPLKKIFVFYSRISYTLPAAGYLTGGFGVVARLLPWRLCSRVAWASLWGFCRVLRGSQRCKSPSLAHREVESMQWGWLPTGTPILD